MDMTFIPGARYRTIATPIASTLIEKKSRFLCLLAPVASEDEVHATLAAIKKEHWSANHHCYAFRLLDGTERASDDGEPSGTAGRPMLHVLSGTGAFRCAGCGHTLFWRHAAGRRRAGARVHVAWSCKR